MTRLFIATAEVSGDVHGARLLTELKSRWGGPMECDALGGAHLEAAGARILTDLSAASSVGLLEGLPFLFSSLGLMGRMAKHFKAVPYDAVILIDGQGRNLPLMALARKAGLKTVYYFPPPISIWGRWNLKRMRVCDLLLTPFAADHALYVSGGCRSIYTGHPFATLPMPGDRPLLKSALGFDGGRPLLALFPGSRRQEVRTLTRDFLAAAALLKGRIPDLQLVLSLAHPKWRETIESSVAASGLPVTVLEGKADEILRAGDALLTASGTATLQAAFHGMPMAIAYRISRLTYAIGRMLVKGDFIGLPNILAGEEVAPEFINRDLTPEALANAVHGALTSRETREAWSARLLAVREKVSMPDPFGIMAGALAGLLVPGSKSGT